jgi:hypothetical protein
LMPFADCVLEVKENLPSCIQLAYVRVAMPK